MTTDPEAWLRLGRAIRDDRLRKGLRSRQELVDLVSEQGGRVTERTIGSLERGQVIPRREEKPRSLEMVTRALDWPRGAADRILAGDRPDLVLTEESRPTAVELKRAEPRREDVLALLPQVYAFGRGAAALGAPTHLRDEFDAAAERLAAAIPASAPGRDLGLAASRPHAEGEGPTPDDAQRIMQAFDEDDERD